MLTIEERVQNGIKYLDNSVPKWRDRVDLETLNIHSFKNCILGQVFGGWKEIFDIDQGDYGFDAYSLIDQEDDYFDSVTDFRKLTEEWKRQLKEKND